jgi:uncharacterized protein (DUF2062 family)
LSEVELSQLADPLRAACVHGALLTTVMLLLCVVVVGLHYFRKLNDADLLEAGVALPLHRKKLLLHIDRLVQHSPLSSLATLGVDDVLVGFCACTVGVCFCFFFTIIVKRWLQAISLRRYTPMFRQSSVDGLMLPLLTPQLCREELGIVDVCCCCVLCVVWMTIFF